MVERRYLKRILGLGEGARAVVLPPEALPNCGYVWVRVEDLGRRVVIEPAEERRKQPPSQDRYGDAVRD